MCRQSCSHDCGMQAVCRAEVLENELSVLRAEGAEDRISGAAQLLALQQKCEELESRLHASGAVATEGEPATSDATDGEEFAQRQGFSAHSISHKVSPSSCICSLMTTVQA